MPDFRLFFPLKNPRSDKSAERGFCILEVAAHMGTCSLWLYYLRFNQILQLVLFEVFKLISFQF